VAAAPHTPEAHVLCHLGCNGGVLSDCNATRGPTLARGLDVYRQNGAHPERAQKASHSTQRRLFIARLTAG
jgi:hypothetical protein